MSSLVDQLRAVFLRKDTKGQRVFSQEDVDHYVPLLVLELTRKAPDVALPRSAALALAALADEIGLAEDATPDTTIEAIRRYYAEHPPNPDLVARIAEVLKDALVGANFSQGLADAAKFLGQQVSKAPLKKDGPAPEGSIAAGPLARFRLSDTD